MVSLEEPELVLLIHDIFKVSGILDRLFLLLGLTDLLLKFLLFLSSHLLTGATGLLVLFSYSRMGVTVRSEGNLKGARKR
jgi:hypothetical protein